MTNYEIVCVCMCICGAYVHMYMNMYWYTCAFVYRYTGKPGMLHCSPFSLEAGSPTRPRAHQCDWIKALLVSVSLAVRLQVHVAAPSFLCRSWRSKFRSLYSHYQHFTNWAISLPREGLFLWPTLGIPLVKFTGWLYITACLYTVTVV